MKIQCACGAKYAFEVTPEQAHQRVQFVCPACGLDSSDYLTDLVRQQFGIGAPGPGAAPAVEIAAPPSHAPAPADSFATTVTPRPPVPVAAPEPVTPPPPPPVRVVAPQSVAPPPAPVPTVRLHRGGQKATEAEAEVKDTRFCAKHPGVRTTETCCVCQKPICPKCMELSGYVCSPLCKQKAELRGIDVPVFEGQKALVERRRSRKLGWVFATSGTTVAAVLGLWIWWTWIGQTPRVAFAVRFETPAYSGSSVLCAPEQIVFLHGATLARHDVKASKEIWSRSLIDKAKIAADVERELKRLRTLQEKLNSDFPDADPIKIPAPEKLARQFERATAESLELRIVGQNIWVQWPDKLVRYDWDTGAPAKELAVEGGGFRGFIARGDELLMLDEQPGRHIITHINLASATTRTEEIIDPEKPAAAVVAKSETLSATNKPAAGAVATRGAKKTSGGAGLPIGKPGADGGKPLDPAKVEEQAAHMTLAGRIASPAVLAANRNQERTLAAMNDSGKPRPTGDEPAPEPTETFSLMPAKDGYVEFSTRLIEQRLVARKAMKEAPKKSALDGPVSVGASMETANQLLNEMQRERGGDTVMEDESRYSVTLRRADAKDTAKWTGEVIGHPSIFPLQSVNVITGNRSIIVLDKDNKKMWSGELSYNVERGGSLEVNEKTGQGPCVERGDTLFVFDEGVLTAFDLKKGTVRWRLPSVGISGLFFDEQGKLYVNSTTASPDSIKYSRQIDITRGTSGLLMKVEPATGKTLWTREINGTLAYVSGKYIFTLQSYAPPGYDSEEENPYQAAPIMQTDPFVRIRRINPANGKDLWAHFQLRCPMDVRFDRNKIHLVFKREVQVLKFLTL
ncbi:MAG: hypothetical protein EXS35_02415 [Pedosphaera sp.]|nr:hypothetical protein [Pedosphaera sp.]